PPTSSSPTRPSAASPRSARRPSRSWPRSAAWGRRSSTPTARTCSASWPRRATRPEVPSRGSFGPLVSTCLSYRRVPPQLLFGSARRLLPERDLAGTTRGRPTEEQGDARPQPSQLRPAEDEDAVSHVLILSSNVAALRPSDE